MEDQRLDRQLRIENWNQKSLEEMCLGIVGDNDIPYFLVASSAALGINRFRSIVPERKTKFDTNTIARAVNLNCLISHLNALSVNKAQCEYLADPTLLVDTNGFAMSKKISLELLFKKNKKGILALAKGSNFSMYGYERGRENELVKKVLPVNQLPKEYEVDPLLELIGSGVILEEAKNVAMGKKLSPEVISYDSTFNLPVRYNNKKILVVGAGALGNFVGLSLALIGVNNVDIIDPDNIEEANLNRQILFYNAIGRDKAEVLAERLSPHIKSVKGIVGEFTESNSLRGYDVVFDCVDNFEVRRVISDACEREKVHLVSGGTSYRAGQVACFIPGSTKTIKEVLNLENLIEAKRKEREARREGCLYQPDPSVIMSNQIIGGIMVDQFRGIFSGKIGNNGIIRYDSEDPKRIGRIEYE